MNIRTDKRRENVEDGNTLDSYSNASEPSSNPEKKKSPSFRRWGKRKATSLAKEARPELPSLASDRMCFVFF